MWVSYSHITTAKDPLFIGRHHPTPSCVEETTMAYLRRRRLLTVYHVFLLSNYASALFHPRSQFLPAKNRRMGSSMQWRRNRVFIAAGGGLQGSRVPQSGLTKRDELELWLKRRVGDLLGLLEGAPHREKCRQEKRTKRMRKDAVLLLQRALFVGMAIALEVWQQIPSRILHASFAFLSSVLPLCFNFLSSVFLGSVGILVSVLLLGGMAAILILLFPLLQLQGEALREDIQHSQSPVDPSSRTSQSLRKVFRSFDNGSYQDDNSRWD